MPANLTAQYRAAEKQYRQASTPEEQLEALQEMLAEIPKHKGTEKLQADIKSRMADLRRESKRKTGPARKRPEHVIDSEGAGQVAVIGPPNSGKSALIRALSGVDVEVAAYPYSTHKPAPAMMPYEDTAVQLLDTPPASEEYAPQWIAELVMRADAAVIVLSLADQQSWSHLMYLIELLSEGNVELWHPDYASTADTPSDEGFHMSVPAVVVATHLDVGSSGDVATEIREVIDDRFPFFEISTTTEEGIHDVREQIFSTLEVIRAYSKQPGEEADRTSPWILPMGSTVHDLAHSIHKDLGNSFEYARIWGSARFDGQRVGGGHVIEDGDVVEIHAR